MSGSAAPAPRRRVRLNDTAEQCGRTWEDLTDAEQLELLPRSVRRALGLKPMGYTHHYVTAPNAATVLGVDRGEFAKLRREHDDELHRKGRRFLVGDLLNLKLRLMDA